MIETMVCGSFFTNSYIISNEQKECIIVDPGMSFGNAAKYIKANYKPVAILITHGHLDHIDGLMYFLDLPIYISEVDANKLSDMNDSLYYMVGRVAPFSPDNLDVRRVNGADTFKLIGFDIKVIATPGHTNGSVCYLVNNTDLFSGDTLFHLSCGRTDFPTGDQLEMRKSLRKLMNMLKDDVKVYPGHDEQTTIGYERENNPWVR